MAFTLTGSILNHKRVQRSPFSFHFCASVFLQELNATMVMRDGVFSLSISPSAFIIEDTPTILSITITIDNAVHQDESVYVIEEDLPPSISVSYSVSA